MIEYIVAMSFLLVIGTFAYISIKACHCIVKRVKYLLLTQI